jgi:hypothetical protein
VCEKVKLYFRILMGLNISLQFAVMYRRRVADSVDYWPEFLATDPEVLVRFPALPDFLRSTGSGTGSTQPRKYN